MSKQIKARRKMIILAGLMVLASAVFFVYYIMIQANMEQAVLYPLNSSYHQTGDYEINPNTILKILDRGETDIFTPIPATENAPYTPFTAGLYPWSQSDYLTIASVLHQFVWKESLRSWRLYSMYFFRGCQDSPIGFDSGEITYFKSINGPFSYTTRVMDIYPAGKRVSWGGDANFPRPLSGWQSINLINLKITADDALQIAEKNGGKEFRSKVNNTCTIDIFLNPNPGGSEDWIIYYNDPGHSVFEMHIAPYSGEYMIISSK